ncbi:MAG TPA: AzlD domain-containing protein [Deltaproteobacteria bacterium]|nr:AzlD domain-containing protein [Deltaproteobacteria bacterium]
MSFEAYLLCIIGMGFVTYIPRWAPLIYLSRRTIPVLFSEWLRLIPAGILSALVVPSLFISKETGHLALFQGEFIVAIPTLLLAWKTKSLALTVIAGMLMYHLWQTYV